MPIILDMTIPIFAFGLIIAIFAYPMLSIKLAVTSIALCSSSIIPSLFPFFVLSDFVTNSSLPEKVGEKLAPFMKSFFSLSGPASIPILLSLFSGAPSGAIIATNMYRNGRLPREEVERVICFTNNASPIFVVGAVSSAFLGLPVLGYMLFAIQIVSATVVGLFTRFFTRKSINPIGVPLYCSNKSQSFFIKLSDTIYASGIAVLKICGLVVFFSVVSGFVSVFVGYLFENKTTLPTLQALIVGMFETTNGIHVITDVMKENLTDTLISPTNSIDTNSIKSIVDTLPQISTMLPLISFLLGIGGISVYSQVAAVCCNVGIKMKKFLIAKIAQGCLAFLLTTLVIKILQIK